MKRFLYFATAIMLLQACKNGDNDFDATGVFEATEIIVSAKTQGEIVSLSIDEGDEVKAQDVLGVIDTTMLALQKRALLANQGATTARQLNVTAQVASLKQQRTNIQQEHERFARLLAKGSATQMQVDELAYQLSVLDKQIAAATEQVSSANRSIGGQGEALEAQILQIQKQLNDSRIKSPITGTILTKYAEAGEFTAPGKPLFKVADVSHLYLRAYITAPQFTTLKLGQKVRVFADQGESDRREYEGTVAWISDKAEFTPKTIQTRDERANLVYAVKIAVKNDGMIKIGMYGEVTLTPTLSLKGEGE